MHPRAALLSLGAAIIASIVVSLACAAQPAGREDRARGEIRLAAPLSSLPSSLAVSADGRFVLASTVDGSVATFDMNSSYGQREVLISTPIRDEELQKQRPIALSPSGDLIAIGVPLERNVPNSARVHFVKRSDNSMIFYTIDNLPSRPLQLSFMVDDKDLLLVALLADKQAPRVWNVSKLRDAARDTTRRPVDPAALKPDEEVLPEPASGFFGNCDRSECHSLGMAIPPTAGSDIMLVVGGDSGIVLYDRNLDVAAYGYVGDGRKDMHRVSGISFSPDGKRIAISRRDLLPGDKYANDSCSVHVYDFAALRATGSDRRIKAEPLFKLDPGTHLGDEVVCFFSHVIWSGDAIFAAGAFVTSPPAGQTCRTFHDLEPGYDKYANMLLRWNAVEGAPPGRYCLGTNVATDMQAIAGGGIVTITPDPSLTVFDHKGNVSNYPAQPNIPRYFDGPIFDIRDGSRGALVTNVDGSIVMLRPLAAPRPTIAFDLMPPLDQQSLVSATGTDPDVARTELQRMLEPHRNVQISFNEKVKEARDCLGVNFPANPDGLNGEARRDLTAALKDMLKFRPTERALTFQFLEPAQGQAEWHLVIGTTHRLMYASCDSHDRWSGKAIAETEFAGVRIRNEAYQLAVSGNRKFVIVAHADGILRWYRMANGQHVLSAFLRPDLRSWLAWNAEGYFDYSFTSGSQIASWVQSTPTGSGRWRVNLQRLSRFNEKWHKPEEVQRIFSDADAGRDVKAVDQTPDTGRPQLQVTVAANADGIKGPTVRLNIRARNTGQDALESPLVVSIEGMADVEFLKAPSRRRQGPDVMIEAAFELPPCLRHPGTSHRFWVRFQGAKEAAYVTYAGPDSGVAHCPQRRVWGIAVGISKYESAERSLNYADQDAQRFFDFWSSQVFYKVGRFALLTAPKTAAARTVVVDATGKPREQPLEAANNVAVRKFIQDEILKIKEEIKNIKNDAAAGDLVVIYLAGHGFSLKDNTADNWFFMPSNGDASDPKETAFGIPKLVTWLDLADFKSTIPIVVFIDACRDLTIYPDKVTRTIEKKINPDFYELTDKYDANLFVASGSAASAYELPETDLLNPKQPPDCVPSSDASAKGGGAFTHVLLEVLNGKNRRDPQGQLPLFELEQRLHDGVKNLCAKQQTRKYAKETSLSGFFFKN